MSEIEEAIDLSAPEYAQELTAEQIAALGAKRKYVDGAYYPLAISQVGVSDKQPIGFSNPKLKNGELNADASGSWWLQYTLEPVQVSGAKSHKLDEIRYCKTFFFDRMSVAAMKRAKYTEEQIKKVAAEQAPNTYDGFTQFARAMFPEKFTEDFPRWNREAKVFTFKGVQISEEAFKAWEAEQKKVYIRLQNELRANPKQLLGKKAFWNVHYPLKDKKNESLGKESWANAAFPYAFNNPPKDKDGNLKPVLDPEKDFS
jgi:hypothetical protein